MPYGYITKLSDKLTREHVRYNNRYGIAMQPKFTTQKI